MKGDDLKKRLLTIPSDGSGAVADNRFDYQKDWAICKLLELHGSGVDFVLCFEYHDDIIVLNNLEANNAEVSFYQVKTQKSGNYSLKKLITKGKKELSVFTKLYKHRIDFEGAVKSLNLVSNQAFNVPLSDSAQNSCERSVIVCDDLHKDAIEKIKNTLSKELVIDKSKIVFESFSYFLVSELPLEQHSSVARDKLNAYIESISPGIKITPSLPYDQLFREVRRKSCYEKRVVTYGDVIRNKAISKTEFSKIISVFVNSNDFDKAGEEVIARLGVEGVDIRFVSEFKSKWKVFTAARTNPSDEILNKLILETKRLAKEVSIDFGGTLHGNMEKVFAKYQPDAATLKIYDADFIKTVILWVVYEKNW